MKITDNIVKELADKHGRTRESLLPIMQNIVSKKSFLSEKDMVDIAKELDLSAAEVFGTASFYSFIDIEPRGEYVIRVCKTITCDMKGKKQIIKTIEDLLKIKLGETTSNKKFSLLATNCLGWCHKGPTMIINDEVYTELDTEKTKKIIMSYIK